MEQRRVPGAAGAAGGVAAGVAADRSVCVKGLRDGMVTGDGMGRHGTRRCAVLHGSSGLGRRP